MGGLVWILGRTIGHNVSAVAAAAPAYEGRLQKPDRPRRRLVGLEHAPTLSELFDRISLADTLGGIAAAAASVVSVAGIVLIYAGFLFVEQVQFRRKLAILFAGRAHQARVRSVLEQIDREIRIYVRIKTTLATVDVGVGLCGDGLGRRRFRRLLGGHGVLLLLHPDRRLDPGDRRTRRCSPWCSSTT